MRRGFLMGAALAVGGCAAGLSPAGREVRLYEGDAVDRCTLVAVVTGTAGNGPSTAENERRATVIVRNRVADRGGNAYTVVAREVTPLSTTLKANALRCPYWEPVPCLAPQPPGSGRPCKASAGERR